MTAFRSLKPAGLPALAILLARLFLFGANALCGIAFPFTCGFLLGEYGPAAAEAILRQAKGNYAMIVMGVSAPATNCSSAIPRPRSCGTGAARR